MASGIYLHAYSQDKLVKYQGEVSLGYAFGVGDIKIDKSSLQIINGVRIGTYFAAGVGVGFDYCGKSSLDSYRLGFSLFGDIKDTCRFLLKSACSLRPTSGAVGGKPMRPAGGMG